MAMRNELIPQDFMIIDLPVEYEPNTAILIAKRLTSSRKIDNRQAPKSQSYAGFAVKRFIVGPSVCHDGGHGAH